MISLKSLSTAKFSLKVRKLKNKSKWAPRILLECTDCAECLFSESPKQWPVRSVLRNGGQRRAHTTSGSWQPPKTWEEDRSQDLQRGGTRLEHRGAAILFASGHRLAFVTRSAGTTDDGSKGLVLRLRLELRAEEVKCSRGSSTLVSSENSGGWLRSAGRL